MTLEDCYVYIPFSDQKKKAYQCAHNTFLTKQTQ